MAANTAFARILRPARLPYIISAPSHALSPYPRRTFSFQFKPPSVGPAITPEALDKLFSEPSWSVEMLLPPKTRAPDAPQITSKQLHHLLRLSALPPPETPEAEQKMQDTLAAQLHFVGEIRQVDTADVKPLRALRDETAIAEQEQTITLDTLKYALANEVVIGKHYQRIQRKVDPVDGRNVEDWDVLGSAERKTGRFFVVESEVAQE